LNLPEIAELWSRQRDQLMVAGSYCRLALDSPDLKNYAGHVSDSGEARWTIAAAIDESVPAPVLSAALYERLSSRGGADFADRVLSAMRKQFGGHDEKKKGKKLT
jgi:6-phosphogluconate dehydrogenase